jgi:hypothetical protein
MKRSFKFLATIIALTFFASSCQEDVESPGQLSEVDILAVENEAVAESAFEDIDDIGFESLLYFESGGRIAENEDSPIRCAVKTHDTENKTIVVDFGEGCIGKNGRERKGKIIITYTDRKFMPGAVHTMTFENFYVDGKLIEGTRTRTNISAGTDDYLRFSVVLENGKVTWEDGTFATREANWETSRIRTPNPINDERIRTGSASGINKEGLEYTVNITKAIVWKRACMASDRIKIPVEGIKVKITDGNTVTVDYGDGTCDNLVTITKDGVSETVELKKHQRNG